MVKTGWYNKGNKGESYRHSLAAKGVKTKAILSHPVKIYEPDPSFSAGTILQQLGGNKFIAMTGAKDFVKDDKNRSIIFKIGRNFASISYVKIRLNSMDTYDMEFFSIRKMELKPRGEEKGVYADQLQEMFTKHTGMNTHL
jgi:hypothetical protein